jgi:hypothetical protein
MRVKVGEVWYNAEDIPICVELNECEKNQIKNMHPDATKYAQFPDSYSKDYIETWIEE